MPALRQHAAEDCVEDRYHLELDYPHGRNRADVFDAEAWFERSVIANPEFRLVEQDPRFARRSVEIYSYEENGARHNVSFDRPSESATNPFTIISGCLFAPQTVRVLDTDFSEDGETATVIFELSDDQRTLLGRLFEQEGAPPLRYQRPTTRGPREPRRYVAQFQHLDASGWEQEDVRAAR